MALLRDELSSAALAESTARRVTELGTRFAAYLERGHSVGSVVDITTLHAEGFIRASLGTRGGPREPSVATMHLRRCALRLLFRLAQQRGVVDADPTLGITLPSRSSLPVRPLTNDEIALCRSFSLHRLRSTRRPAAWALAEATARTAEIPHLRASDVDFDKRRVWIHGSPKSEPRWGSLDDWGASQLARRVEDLERKGLSDALLIYEGSGAQSSQQASSCLVISQTLVAAGLGKEKDVNPKSVTAWAAARILEETGRIEQVARRLGMRSLDRAARLVAWNWRHQDPEDADQNG